MVRHKTNDIVQFRQERKHTLIYTKRRAMCVLLLSHTTT